MRIVLFFSIISLGYTQTTTETYSSSSLASISSETPSSSTAPSSSEESSTVSQFFNNSAEIDDGNNSTEVNSTVIEGSGAVTLENSGENVRFVLLTRKRRSTDRETFNSPSFSGSPRSRRQAALNSLESSSSTAQPVVETIESAEIIQDGSGDVIYEAGISNLRKKRDSAPASKSKSSSENISIDNGTPSRRKRDVDSNLKKVGAAAARIVLDVAQLTRDQDLLAVAVRRMQNEQQQETRDRSAVFDSLGFEQIIQVNPSVNVAARTPPAARTTTATTAATITPATIATTTATAVQAGGSTSTSASPGTTTSGCVPEEQCYSDSDCLGGFCRGNFLGSCNCNACLNYWQCYSDGDCGGFNKACNMTTNLCNCFGAFTKNGYSDTLEALAKFCNVKQCRSQTASQDCYGLPCNSGRCACGSQ